MDEEVQGAQMEFRRQDRSRKAVERTHINCTTFMHSSAGDTTRAVGMPHCSTKGISLTRERRDVAFSLRARHIYAPRYPPTAVFLPRH